MPLPHAHQLGQHHASTTMPLPHAHQLGQHHASTTCTPAWTTPCLYHMHISLDNTCHTTIRDDSTSTTCTLRTPCIPASQAHAHQLEQLALCLPATIDTLNALCSVKCTVPPMHHGIQISNSYIMQCSINSQQ